MRLLSVNPVTNIPHRMLSHEEPRRQRSLHGSRSCRLTSQNKQGQEWWLYDPMISPPSPGPLSVCDTGPPLDTCNISPFPFLHKPMRPFPNHSIASLCSYPSIYRSHVADAGASSRPEQPQQQSRKNPSTSIVEMEKRTRDGHSVCFTMLLVIFVITGRDSLCIDRGCQVMGPVLVYCTCLLRL